MRSKCSGVTAIRPRRDGREVGARLVLEAGVRAVDPVAPAALLLGLELQLVTVDPLAQPRHLDARRRRPPGTLTFSSVPAGSGTSSSRSTRRATKRRGDIEAEAAVEAVVERAGAATAGRRRSPGSPSTTPSSAAATVPE